MSYKLPLKQTQSRSGWITATLVCIYIAIAAIILINV